MEGCTFGIGLRILSCLLPAFVFIFHTPSLPAAGSGPVYAAPQVRVLENRFFFHSYEQDPPQKRLQRLELLVFGRTQAGSNEERLKRLSETIAQRDKESATKTQQSIDRNSPSITQPPAAGRLPTPYPSVLTTPPSASSRQYYPALNALEWRALKKTYPADSLDDRLGRIETKLFGQPSPSMSYADRMERLNRTLGIGVTAIMPPSKIRGPMPKTRTQDGESNFSVMPFSADPNFSSPFFGNSDLWFSTPNQKQLSELFRQMNDQMEQMMRAAPGINIPDYDEHTLPKDRTPSRTKPVPGWKFHFSDGNPSRSEIPPYNDPNSI